MKKIVQTTLERYNTDKKTEYSIDDFNIYRIDQNDTEISQETDLDKVFGELHNEILLRLKNNNEFEEEEDDLMPYQLASEDDQIKLHKAAELLLKNRNYVQSLSTYRLTSLPPSRQAIQLFVENDLSKRFQPESQNTESINPFSHFSFNRLLTELDSLYPVQKKGDLLVEIIKRNANAGIDCLFQEPELFMLIPKIYQDIPDITSKIIKKIQESSIKTNGVVCILSIIAKSNCIDIFCQILTTCITVADLSAKSCYEIAWILYQYRRSDILIPIVDHWLGEINNRVDESLHICLVHGALGLICSFPPVDDRFSALSKKQFDYSKITETELYTIRIIIVAALLIYEEGFLGAFSAIIDAIKNIIDVGVYFLREYPEWQLITTSIKCASRVNMTPRFPTSVFVIGDEYSIIANYRIMKPFGTCFSHSIRGLSLMSLRTQTQQRDMFVNVLESIQPFDVIFLFLGTVDIEKELPKMLQEGDTDSVVSQLEELAVIMGETVEEIKNRFPGKKIFVHKVLTPVQEALQISKYFNERIQLELSENASFVDLHLPPLYNSVDMIGGDIQDDWPDKYAKAFFNEFSENRSSKKK